MAKATLIGNRLYRKRRGKLVEISPEWIGRFTHKQTMRKRKSKRKGYH